MKVFYKKGGGIGFARKEPYEYDGVKYEADIQNSDVIKILDGGNIEEGKFGEQHNFRIETRNGEKKLAFNQPTINILLQELGDETEEWIGKEVKVLIVKKMIAGKRAIIPYLIVGEWKLDEFGELTKIVIGEQDEPEIGGHVEEKPDENPDVNLPF